MDISNAALQPETVHKLRQRAQELEATFLAEMLGHAGLQPEEGEFGGGIGEDQFSSFLREAQAKAIVESGGIGLAESIFQALSQSQGRADDR